MDGNEKPILPRFRIVIRWFAGVIAIIYFVTAGSLLFRGIQSTKWVQASGTVTKLEFEDSLTIRTSVWRGARPARIRRTHFLYDYIYNNQSFSGRQQTLFDSTTEGQLAKYTRLSRKYQVGDKVTVHVNPANPADSCLEPGVVKTPVVNQAVYGLLFAAIALGTFLNKSGRQKSKSASTNE